MRRGQRLDRRARPPVRADPAVRRRRHRPARSRAGAAAWSAKRRTLYRNDDLTGAAARRVSSSRWRCRARPTARADPRARRRVFGSRAAGRELAAALADVGYVPAAPATPDWWIAVGPRCTSRQATRIRRLQELAAARATFFLPRRAVDPFGGISRVAYDATTCCRVDRHRSGRQPDRDGQRLPRARSRRRSPTRTAIAAAVAFDALGLVAGTAVMGKQRVRSATRWPASPPTWTMPTLRRSSPTRSPHPRRLLGSATTRLIYDLYAYQRTATIRSLAAAAVYMLARETHVSRSRPPPAHRPTTSTRFAYCDGFGREIQTQGARRAGAGDRRRPGRDAALGRVRLDDLRQQGPPGPRLRAVLHRDAAASSSPPRPA